MTPCSKLLLVYKLTGSCVPQAEMKVAEEVGGGACTASDDDSGRGRRWLVHVPHAEMTISAEVGCTNIF